jgi:outer membrane receptor for Fe3+-dicitrate
VQRLLILIFILSGLKAFGQTTITGYIKDKTLGTELPFATIRLDSTKTIIAGEDGSFNFKYSNQGIYFSIKYFGYFTLDTFITSAKLSEVKTINFELISRAKEIKKAVITTEIAKPRSTPIAYTNVNQRKLSEIQSSQDMVMALNTVPGVYATEQGGGSGDARISIRGFNQRNIAVMVDGIPVNDMENGQVYWSNWFGISSVLKLTQVQRGLGAGKLANPSIGGSINMLTMEVGAKPKVLFKQEFGTANYQKTVLTASTGMYKGKIGLLLSTTQRKSDGWVNGLYDDMASYFAKVEYRPNPQNRIVLSAFASPQSHGQRSFRAILGTYDTLFAQENNMDTAYPGQPRQMGARYNRHLGYYYPGTQINGDDTILGEKTLYAERRNRFNKPQFYIKHTHFINQKVTWNNTLYASYGRGAGFRFSKTPVYDENYQYDFQRVYLLNKFGNSFVSPIDTRYSNTLKINREGFLQGSHNNHNWVGGLSVLNVQQEHLSFTTGIDIRRYRGRHYQEVEDLIGADYMIAGRDANPRRENEMYFVGDRFNYDNTGIINWNGWFTELEYNKNDFSAVISGSGSVSTYQYQDHFNYDTTHFSLTGGYKDILSNKKVFPTFNLKGGASYNFSEHIQVYGNLGRLERAPRFTNVFDFNGNEMLDPKNEEVMAIEAGMKYKSKRLSFNFNIYRTQWTNKPLDRTPSYTDADGNRFNYNVNGLKALHQGIELEGIVVLVPRILELEIATSLGDWIWTSGANVIVLDEDGNQAIDQNGQSVQFDFSANGVHVGDAAQRAMNLQLNIKPTSGFYIKPMLSLFGKHYTDFEPASLQNEYKDRESFLLPSYHFINLHIGKYFKLKKINKGKSSLRVYASIINLTDNLYITDGQHRLTNGFGSISVANAFNPKNVEVFVSQGRRITFGISFRT